jgi:hypothetical protein
MHREAPPKRVRPALAFVQFAVLAVEQERAADALRAARDLAAGLGRTISPAIVCAAAPPAPFVPVEHHFAPVVTLILVGFGDPEEHAATVAAAREVLQPLFDIVTPTPYVALQQMLDDGNPWGTRSYTKGLYLDVLPDGAIDVLAGRLSARLSGHSEVLIAPLGEGIADVPDDATAFGGSRSLRYVVAIECKADDEETFARDRHWVRDTWDALRPAAVHDGAYVNLNSEFAGDSLRNTYGAAKFDRLRSIKAQYDPTNVFRHNANIPPAGGVTQVTNGASAESPRPEAPFGVSRLVRCASS